MVKSTDELELSWHHRNYPNFVWTRCQSCFGLRSGTGVQRDELLLAPLYLPWCSLLGHARCSDEKRLVVTIILNSCFNLNWALSGWFWCFKIRALHVVWLFGPGDAVTASDVVSPRATCTAAGCCYHALRRALVGVLCGRGRCPADQPSGVVCPLGQAWPQLRSTMHGALPTWRCPSAPTELRLVVTPSVLHCTIFC